jgi:hypothetical protein
LAFFLISSFKCVNIKLVLSEDGFLGGYMRWKWLGSVVLLVSLAVSADLWSAPAISCVKGSTIKIQLFDNAAYNNLRYYNCDTPLNCGPVFLKIHCGDKTIDNTFNPMHIKVVGAVANIRRRVDRNGKQYICEKNGKKKFAWVPDKASLTTVDKAGARFYTRYTCEKQLESKKKNRFLNWLKQQYEKAKSRLKTWELEH